MGPLLLSIVAIVTSIALDLDRRLGVHHFMARSGAIVALCGAVSGYGGATRIWIRRGDPPLTMIRGVREVPYGVVGLILGTIGTLLWAYGDLIF
jgi:hypothetical protein